jgi:hypothetical protein
MTREVEVRQIKRRHSAELLGRPGVCGVGVEKDETGDFILAIHLESNDPAIRASLPDQIEGHPVRFVVSGPFRKQ